MNILNPSHVVFDMITFNYSVSHKINIACHEHIYRKIRQTCPVQVTYVMISRIRNKELTITTRGRLDDNT